MLVVVFFLILNSDWKKLCFFVCLVPYTSLKHVNLMCLETCVDLFYALRYENICCWTRCNGMLRGSFAHSLLFGSLRREGWRDYIKFTDIWTNLPSFEVHIVFYLSQNCTKYIIIEKLWKKKEKEIIIFPKKY